MSVGGGGGGYSGGGGGFSGGFGPPPMFGGGFGQQFPSYGGGFGAFGPQPYSGFGGGFGGGFGMPQQPQYGGGFGGGFGQPQPPQFGGGFGLNPMLPGPPGGSNPGSQDITYGVGDMAKTSRFVGGQRGPGNAYARPFPQMQPQPAPLPPPTQPTPIPPPGMEANPNYIPFGQLGPAVGDTSSPFRPIDRSPPPGMKINPTYDSGYAMADDMPLPGSPQALRKQPFIPDPDYTPTGGGYPSRDQFNQTFQLMPAVERPIQAERAVMPQVPTGGGYPSRDSFGTNLSPVIEPTGTGYMSGMGGGLMGMLGGGLGGLFGGYQAMPFGGYQVEQQYPSNYQAAQQQMALERQRMQQPQMIPLGQRDPNSMSLTTSYMDPASGRMLTAY